MKNLSLKVLGVVLIIIFLMYGNINLVLAASTAEKDKLTQEQEENNQKINETKEQLENIQAEKSETVKQVESLTDEISKYQSQIDELDSKISDLNTQIEEAEENLNKAQEDYSKQEKLLEARLVATYEAGETSYLDFLLSSDSITDLISNYYLVTEVATNDAELLDQIEKQKQEIENAKQTLEASKNELATSKASKQSITTQLEASKKEKDEQVAKLSEEEQQTQAELEQYQADNDKITKELAAAEARYQAQLEALKKQQESGNSSSSGSSSSSGGGSYNSGRIWSSTKAGKIRFNYSNNVLFKWKISWGIRLWRFSRNNSICCSRWSSIKC